MGGQQRGQVPAQRGAGDRGAGGGLHVRGEPVGAADGRRAVRSRRRYGAVGRAARRGHGGRGDVRVAQQGRLHLAGLDAVAADVELRVDPPEEQVGAVREAAGQVAGAVEQAAGAVRREAVGDEVAPGFRRAVEVAESDAGAADVDLAGFPVRYGGSPLVQEVYGDAGQRVPDARGALSGAAAAHGGADARLGRPVRVEQAHPAAPAPYQVLGQRLAAGGQGGDGDGLLLRQRRHQRGGAGEVTDVQLA
ncbi:hypothetical protein DMH18_36300 [Streptomyces sp. WAC 06783]|nr:hypothetical protein DMH18_36300 [Streptomyces sp. WAC 06783]